MLKGPFLSFSRLFWHLFLGLCLVITFTSVGVWYSVSRSYDSLMETSSVIDWRWQGRRAIKQAKNIYLYTGKKGLIAWLNDKDFNHHPTVFIFSADQKEISGRKVPAQTLEAIKTYTRSSAKFLPHQKTFHKRIIRRGIDTITIDGKEYWVVAVKVEELQRLLPPILKRLPLGTAAWIALVMTFLISALLARFYARPLEKLDKAMSEFTQGNHSVRISQNLHFASSEIKHVSLAFDEMAEHIEQLLNRQKRLFHDVSHEIRSPLARIAVALEIAKRAPERLDDSLLRIEKEIAQVDALIDALLTYARLDSKEQIVKNNFYLYELLDELRENLQYEAQQKTVSIHYDNQIEKKLFFGNPELLSRALENIARNALRVSPEKGNIFLVAQQSIDVVSITISDEGPGMSSEDINHIFDPFRRGEKESTGTGFGLGLAIAYRAIKKHNGRISLQNVKPHGLQVQILLPLINKGKD